MDPYIAVFFGVAVVALAAGAGLTSFATNLAYKKEDASGALRGAAVLYALSAIAQFMLIYRVETSPLVITSATWLYALLGLTAILLLAAFGLALAGSVTAASQRDTIRRYALWSSVAGWSSLLAMLAYGVVFMVTPKGFEFSAVASERAYIRESPVHRIFAEPFAKSGSRSPYKG